MNEEAKEELKSLYYDHANPASFGGVDRLWKAARRQRPGLRREDVEDWLRGQDAYTLHKDAREKFTRSKTVVGGPGQQLQADLVDVRRHASHNAGTNFLLTVVDAFSRKAWVRPVKNKTGERVAEALEDVLKEADCFSLQTDKGKEFYNDKVRSVLRRRNIKHFSTENETVKASIVERFNKSLRLRLHRSMTARGTERFLQTLPDVVKAHNRTYNSSIGMAPADVNDANRERVFQRLDSLTRTRPRQFRVSERGSEIEPGDKVRITKARGAFERGYTPNWTREVFTVTSVLSDRRPTRYAIEDYDGEPVKGTFYRQELQLVKDPDRYAVEEVLATRRRRGGKEFLVKWLGYPESFNSWVAEKDMDA